jgi:uncharacterized protein (TIGR02466 family)
MTELFEKRLFFTPMFSRTISYNVDEMIEYVDLLKQVQPSLTNSNVGGWHSKTFLNLDDQPDVILDLFREIDKDISDIYQKYDFTKQPELSNWWIMSNGKYAYNRSHSHPGALISGVTYIKIPKNSGNINFTRPDTFYDYTGPYQTADVNNLYSMTDWQEYPEVGKVVYFPAYLKHEVTQNLTEDEDDQRIALAFNYR